MLSMSDGFRSAIRFTGLSWFDEFKPPAACVAALRPFEMAVFATGTPSTTYSGCDRPKIDVTPRIRTCNPPPGAPEFAVTTAPATLPWSASSTVWLCVRLSSSALTDCTPFARFRRVMLVAWPVTTSSLNWSAVALSLMSTSLWSAVMGMLAG